MRSGAELVSQSPDGLEMDRFFGIFLNFTAQAVDVYDNGAFIHHRVAPNLLVELGLGKDLILMK